MSIEKEQFVPAAMERLKMALNLDSDAALARQLKVQPVLVSRWKMREKKNLDKIEIISGVAKNNGISLHWLFTGEGEMFMDPKRKPQYSRDERELIDLYRMASEEAQSTVRVVLRSSASELPAVAERSRRYGGSKKRDSAA